MDRKHTARTMRKECSSDVSSRSFGGALRDIQKTAARETSWNAARDHLRSARRHIKAFNRPLSEFCCFKLPSSRMS